MKEILRKTTIDDVNFLMAQRKAPFFVFNFAKTLDPHDRKNPIKLFPAKPHILVVIQEFLTHYLLAYPKSRQMQLTWTIITMFLWEAWSERGGLYFFQSKKEDDANDLIWRTWHVWSHLPDFLKQGIVTDEGQKYLVPLTVNPSSSGKHRYCNLEIVDNRGNFWSKITGVPQGPDQIRMHTAKGILSDETAFQEAAELAYAASKPTLEGGGRLVYISTAAHSYFERVCKDKIEEAA